MSKRFPAVNYRQVAKIARKIGFYFYRQGKGSHEVWRRDADQKQTTIPNHGSKTFKRKTLRAIIDDFGITIEGFKTMLRS